MTYIRLAGANYDKKKKKSVGEKSADFSKLLSLLDILHTRT